MNSTRNRITRCLIAATLSVPAFATTGCVLGTPAAPKVATQTPAPPAQPPAPTSQRSGMFGTAKAAQGVNANLAGLRITAHLSMEHLRNYLRSGLAEVSGTGLRVSWEMSLPQGTYYVLAWLDQDNSGTLSYGDIVGVVGEFGLMQGDLTPVQVYEGRMADAGQIKCEVIYGTPAWMKGDDSK